MQTPTENDTVQSGSPTVAMPTARPTGVAVRTIDEPWMQTLSLVARLVLGGVMLIAGAEKISALPQFAISISNYQLLPLESVNIVALLIVWTEVTVGVLLIAGAAVRGSALVSGALLALFIVAILTAMARGLDINCGCAISEADLAAGNKGEQVGWPKIFVNLATLAAAIFLIYFPKSYLTIDRLIRRERELYG